MTDILSDTVYDELPPEFDSPESPPIETKVVDAEVIEEEIKPSESRKPRKSAAKFLERFVGFGGMALMRSGRDIPVGRVLMFEAPIAGKRLDNAIEGTFLDRLIQPFVRVEEGAESVGAVVLFPLLVGIMERSPATAPVVEPILREVIETVAIDLAADLKARRRKTTNAAKALADLSEAFELEPGEDPIEAILNGIFAMPETVPPTGATNGSAP
jgi:hypothetical protein